MYFVISIFLFSTGILEVILKKKIVSKFFFLFSMSLLFIIVGYNNWNPDLDNYKTIYEISKTIQSNKRYEPFFLAFINFTKVFYNDFYFYQKIYAFLTIFLIGTSFYKFTKFPNFLIANFFIMPLFPNIVQMRQFLAFSLFFYGISGIDEKNKKSYIFIILSLFCHYSMILVLPFFIIKRFNFFKNKKIWNLIIIISFLLIQMPKTFIIDILNIIGGTKYTGYIFNSYRTISGTLYLLFPFYIMNFFVIILNLRYKNKLKYLLEPDEYIKTQYMIELINYSNILLLPTIFIRDILRVYMNFYIFNLVYLIIFVNIIKFSYDRNKKIYYYLLIYLTTILIFIIEFLSVNLGSYFEVINRSLLDNRILNNIF